MDVIRKKRKPMSEINVVPYIDVMLVLLVVFMVTAPLMNQGIEVDLPQANNEPLDIDENLETLVISITENQEYYISLGATSENRAPSSLDEIGRQVTQVLGANPGIQVLVEGDTDANWGTMIALITTLQDAGVANPNFITQPMQSL
ncbi:MAG: ExbD/TolR family protein [Gammaproteobacteria bacterium]|nr:ExbD/TolR family protein [Pseudomonadales bacterium]MCP5345971.1 ExbD/TolR family protein [Pseudomonadales bacterium]